FYGDLIARPEAVEGADVELKNERVRVLPDGGRVSVKYGVGEVKIEGMVTAADVEVWEGLKQRIVPLKLKRLRVSSPG
ncbi:MAG: hypothetical protein QW808_02105, partial [Desulfurococcaceae archaeon]